MQLPKWRWAGRRHGRWLHCRNPGRREHGSLFFPLFLALSLFLALVLGSLLGLLPELFKFRLRPGLLRAAISFLGWIPGSLPHVVQGLKEIKHNSMRPTYKLTQNTTKCQCLLNYIRIRHTSDWSICSSEDMSSAHTFCISSCRHLLMRATWAACCPCEADEAVGEVEGVEEAAT